MLGVASLKRHLFQYVGYENEIGTHEVLHLLFDSLLVGSLSSLGARVKVLSMARQLQPTNPARYALTSSSFSTPAKSLSLPSRRSSARFR